MIQHAIECGDGFRAKDGLGVENIEQQPYDHGCHVAMVAHDERIEIDVGGAMEVVLDALFGVFQDLVEQRTLHIEFDLCGGLGR
jgi:hypothetical protein